MTYEWYKPRVLDFINTARLANFLTNAIYLVHCETLGNYFVRDYIVKLAIIKIIAEI